MKAMVTGAYGQDGSYLCKLLLEKGYQVYAASPRSSHDFRFRHRILGIEDDVYHLSVDVSEGFHVCDLIQKTKFDEIYNLAAQSFVGASWDNPFATTSANAIGAMNILDAIRRFSSGTKFYQASTSEMFGKIREPLQSEDTPFHPRSPYGVSKLFAHSLTVNYRESFDIFACSGILFNHESPLRGQEFVTKKISQYFANYKNSKGLIQPLKLGNIEAKRDWGYAPEYVHGMWQMMQQSEPDDFVLATGTTYTVREFCTAVATALKIDLRWEGRHLQEVAIDEATNKTVISIDENLYRPAEVDILIGNPSKARQILGWTPKKFMHEIARDMALFDYYSLTGAGRLKMEEMYGKN